MGIESMMNNGMSLSEKLSMSVEMLVLGMGMVFLVLIIIWGVLELVHLFFAGMNKTAQSSSNSADNAPAEPIIEPTVEPEPAEAVYDSDEEIAAAVSAAVACMLDKSESQFRVVSFRKVGKRR